MTTIGSAPGATLETLAAALERAHRDRTPRSRALYERALRTLPGGSTRTATYYSPYPAYMERGAGCRLTDVDGNVYIDCLGNYTSLVHGHARAELVAALASCGARGTAHGAPVEAEIALAEAIVRRLPSIERLRFTNSGTEAVMGAVRAARAYTGRPKVLKMEGGYHGSYDAAEVSVDPGAAPPTWPAGRPDGAGLSPGLTGEVLIAPFNDLPTTRALVERHRQELAAVIVEPVMGAAGVIPATESFLRGLRAATRDAGVLLIFDEVVTFRLAVGGAQELYGVVPDLTTLGKVIGGGLPIGAFGGRAAIMAAFDARHPEAISHSGTFNGNMGTMTVGRVALELLTGPEIARINALGDRLRAGMQAAADAVGLPARVSGVGSLGHVHPSRARVSDYRSASAAASRRISALLHLGLLTRGVFIAPRGMLALSTAMTDADVDLVIHTFREAAAAVADATNAADVTLHTGGELS